MSTQEPKPFTGAKGLDKAIEAGTDPNADLTAVDKSETKAQAALTMALYGASPSEIAKVLGYSSPYRARSAYERVLSSVPISEGKIEHKREMAIRRYSKLLSVVMKKAMDPNDPQHLAYHARAAAMVDRMVKVEGVEAPQQVQVSATDEMIGALLTRFVRQGNDDIDSGEADIIDADIIEEGDSNGES